MKKILVASLISLVFGVLIGVYFPVLLLDGRHGIQWDFNDAASRGDVREMERLIEKGADPLISPTWAGGGGSYPLAAAASEGEPEAVEFLIKRGANVNFLQGTERVLGFAMIKKDSAEKCVELLKAHGARPFGFRDEE